MTSRPVILSLQGYPEKFMKTKERENISHPNPGSITGLRRPNATAPGGGPTLTSGSSIHSLQGYPEKFMKTKEREKFSRTTPGSIPGVRCPHAAAAGGAPTLTSSSSIHSLLEYPEKFMKTKEQENSIWRNPEEFAREVPLTIPYPGGEGTCGHESIPRPRARVPCPVSRGPNPAPFLSSPIPHGE